MTGTPPPPPRPTFKERLDKLGGVATAMAVVGGVVVSGVAVTGGYVKQVYEYVRSADDASSKISAMDERLRLIETTEKDRLSRALAEAIKAAEDAADLKYRIEEARRMGQNVDGLQTRLSQVELKISEYGEAIRNLKERRR